MATEPPETIAPEGPPRRRLLIVGAGLLALIGCIAVAGAAAALLTRSRGSDPDQPGAPPPSVAYIMDISPRMALSAGRDSRLAVARSIFGDVVRRSDPGIAAGFRIFGEDRVAEACQDTELLVPFAPANHERIADRLIGLTVGGSSESALGQAMIEAVRDLRDESGPQYIVVVTGGPDSCNPEAGRLVAEEAERSGIHLQTFVVGFQVPAEEAEGLRRMVESSGGRYFAAASEEELRRILENIQRAIESGSALQLESGEPAASPEPEEPTGEPGPPSTGGELAGHQSQTACDHPYFPLREGARWEYSYDGMPATWDVVSVDGDLEAATATVVIAMEGLSITYTWDCDAGGIFWYQTGDFDFTDFGEEFDTTITSQSGSPIPPPDAFVPGASWTSAYTMEMRFEAEGITSSITNQIEETHTAGAPEQRRTPAGTREVIPISTAGTTTTTIMGISFTSTSSGTCWYAVGIGWLGCVITSEDTTSSSSLLSYSIP